MAEYDITELMQNGAFLSERLVRLSGIERYVLASWWSDIGNRASYQESGDEPTDATWDTYSAIMANALTQIIEGETESSCSVIEVTPHTVLTTGQPTILIDWSALAVNRVEIALSALHTGANDENSVNIAFQGLSSSARQFRAIGISTDGSSNSSYGNNNQEMTRLWVPRVTWRQSSTFKMTVMNLSTTSPAYRRTTVIIESGRAGEDYPSWVGTHYVLAEAAGDCTGIELSLWDSGNFAAQTEFSAYGYG